MSRGRVAQVLGAALGALALVPAAASAVPRGEDNYQQADLLAPSTVFTFDNSGATIQAGEPLTNRNGWCPQAGAGSTMEQTLWWYVIGTGGRIIISSRGSSFDSLVTVYKSAGAPAIDANTRCSDDVYGTDDAEITLENTEAGARYLVQAGACHEYRDTANNWYDCGANGGQLNLSAITNDQRAHADPATSGARANVGAQTDSGEVLTCGSAKYGSTVWFRHTVTSPGTLTANTSRFDTVLALYRGSESQPLACSDGSAPDNPLTERLSQYVQPGEYFIQVGGKDFGSFSAQDNFIYDLSFQEDLDLDKDGSPRPEDCDDSNPNVRPGKPDIAHNGIDEDCAGGDNKDGDGDGHIADFAGGDDCDDTNRHINPGVADDPNNGIDENCDGVDKPAKLPTTPQVSFRSAPFGNGVVFATMYVRDLRKGYRVLIRCKRSSKCPKTYRKKVKRGKQIRFHKFRRKAFGSRTRIEVFVWKPGNVIGFYKSYTVRGRKNPKQRVCELDPRKRRKPVRCR